MRGRRSEVAEQVVGAPLGEARDFRSIYETMLAGAVPASVHLTLLGRMLNGSLLRQLLRSAEVVEHRVCEATVSDALRLAASCGCVLPLVFDRRLLRHSVTWRMDDRSLQCFIALAEALHFGRAAQRANISQPGLSGQIRRLEKRLGGALFRRTSRHVELTPAGAALLPHARAAVAAYAKGLKQSRAALKATPDRRLVIGLTNLSANWGAHAIIDAFKAGHPRLLIETREITSVDQEIALASGELDASFLHPPFARTLRHQIIGRERLIAAIPRSSKLAEARTIRLADLAAARLILFPRANGPALYGQVLSAFQAKNLTPDVGEFATPFSAVLAAVAAGRGVALVASCFRGQHTKTVAYRNIADVTIDIPIALAWRDDLDDPVRDSLLAHSAQRRDNR